MKLLEKKDILNIDPADLPLLVLSFNYRDFIATAINIRRQSHYNHLMWLYEPGQFASQGAFFQLEPAENYLTHHRLKFWHNPKWSELDKNIILAAIQEDLNKPKWKTRYDWLAIAGQLIGLGFIQNPLTRICSDYGSYLQKADPRYGLKHPAPDNVNDWLKGHKEYEVYGRYIAD